MRFISVGYLINFQRIIKQYSSLSKEQKSEVTKKEE